jgi:hypothetical protein
VQIDRKKRFLGKISKRSAVDAAVVAAVVAPLAAIFGRLHHSTGASVRPTRPPVYGLRGSRALRIGLVRPGEKRKVESDGSPDEVSAYLRDSR